MITVFIIFIVAFILVGLLVKVIWDLLCDKDDEKSISEKLMEGGLAMILATLPSFSDALLQFLYDWLQVEKTVGHEGLSPRWLIALGFVLLAVGVIMKFFDAKAGYFILNMPGTIHHTKGDGMLKALKIQNCEEIETSTVDCQAEMQRLTKAGANAIIADIKNQMDRFNRESKS